MRRLPPRTGALFVGLRIIRRRYPNLRSVETSTGHRGHRHWHYSRWLRVLMLGPLAELVGPPKRTNLSPDRPSPHPLDRGFFVPGTNQQWRGEWPRFPDSFGAMEIGACSRCRSVSSLYYHTLQRVDIYGGDRELFRSCVAARRLKKNGPDLGGGAGSGPCSETRNRIKPELNIVSSTSLIEG
jgi:hypothetical protein